MAVLYFNPEGIVSDKGLAPSKLRSYMAKSYGYSTVAIRLLELEKAGLVVRELTSSRGGGTFPNQGAKCRGIYLAVDRDDLPLEREFIEELREAIRERSTRKSLGQKAAKKKAALEEIPAQHSVPVVVSSAPEGGAGPDASDATLVADALLNRVVQVIQEQSQTAASWAKLEKAEADLVRTREIVKGLQEQVTSRDRNIKVLTDQVNGYAETTARLRRQVEARQNQISRDTQKHLTTTVADALGADGREALARLTKAATEL
jgi:hypothetical protein